MIALPKLILLVALAAAAFYFVRWFNRPSVDAMRREAPSSRRGQGAIEDLVACRVCGAYVAPDGHGCDKPGCPHRR